VTIKNQTKARHYRQHMQL